MKMKNAAAGLVVLGAVCALPQGSFAQESTAGGALTGAPFVGLSLVGSDVVLSSERLRYSVRVDPGTYYTVFLISPNGVRSVLNPFERAIRGSQRQTIIRQTGVGLGSGEAYLVAVATRSGFNRSNLVRRSQSAGRLAGANIGAVASLNHLLTAIMPKAGDDFSATYVSFRVIPRGLGQTYSYAARCYGSAVILGNSFEDDGFYIRRSLEGARFDVLADQDPLLYSLDLPYLSACRGGLFTRAMLIARAPTPSVPIAHRDSGSVSDSAQTHIKYPTMPTPIGTGPFRENARPVMEERGVLVPRIIAPPLRVNPIDGGERKRRQPFNEPTTRIDPPVTPPVASPPQVSPSPSPSPRLSPTPLPAPVNSPPNPVTIPPAD